MHLVPGKRDIQRRYVVFVYKYQLHDMHSVPNETADMVLFTCALKTYRDFCSLNLLVMCQRAYTTKLRDLHSATDIMLR